MKRLIGLLIVLAALVVPAQASAAHAPHAKHGDICLACDKYD